ncbi:MAG: DUF1579 domain-containing protein [Ignavibacterium sp.]|jgi:hypothetical protein|nr:DUF1579 domain-containing protein [Ignavibacterium sp.]
MKSLFRFSLILVSLSSFLAIAQDVNQEEMMKQWQSYMTPGPEHKMLMDMVGEWEGDITMWMDPSQPPQKTTGTTKYESLMDGRYVVGHYSGMMMGMPFNGMDITGYDNALKAFQNVWIDNMGTGMMITEGFIDKDANTITYKGKMVMPDGSKADVKNVVTILDKDHSTFEMFVDMGSGETKSMEIKYKRKS